MRDYSISPRDRWLALHPDKTPEDWGTIVKDGLRKRELYQLDGRVYLSEAEKKRRQNERQRLCRKRRKERIAAMERENAKLRELVRDFYPFVSGHAAKPWLAVRRDRMRELGVEV